MPSVTLRFVTGTQRTLDLADDATVITVKDIVGDEFMRDTVRVCFKGDVLEENTVIASIGLTDADRLIITGRRLAGAPPPSANNAPAPLPGAAGPTPGAAAPPQAAAAKAAVPAGGGMNVDQASLNALESMGFTNKAEASQALRAAFNNVDRAVEYLCTGIPPQVLQQMNEGAAPAPAAPAKRPVPPPAAPGPAAPAPAASGGRAADLFAPPGGNAQDNELRQRLTSLPQYPQMVQLVRENPATLPEILEQLRIHHNDIFTLAAARPQHFAALLSASTEGASPQQGQPAGTQHRTLRGRGQEDEAPIQRLVAMGAGAWDERDAALVYIVTERNEEAAANLLIDNNGLPAELRPALEQYRDQLAPPS